MATPMPTAQRMPAKAPISPSPPLPPLACTAASRKTAVSKPSFSTARKAIATRANELPDVTARWASRSSSPLSWKACWFIQMTIVVTKTTATAPITVSSISCCTCGREADSRSRPTPTPTLMATASATPTNIGRSEWPFRLRKAATMLTIRVASRPSRSPIRKVPRKTPCTANQLLSLDHRPSTVVDEHMSHRS